mgnify:FL=1
MPKTKAELSRIAHKAVATRRKNQKAKARKRSAAAKKAWVTRKLNAEKKRRSDIAKKAVATRRRNNN